MIRLIRFIITGDWHKCDPEYLMGIPEKDFHKALFPKPGGVTRFHPLTRCKHCGKIKGVKV